MMNAMLVIVATRCRRHARRRLRGYAERARRAFMARNAAGVHEVVRCATQLKPARRGGRRRACAFCRMRGYGSRQRCCV